jgi:DNA-directed RNA polymerase specialized sigma24 family protein
MLRDELANQLAPVAGLARKDFLRGAPQWRYLRDDLLGEAMLAVARVIDRLTQGESIDNPRAYAYKAARRSMLALVTAEPTHERLGDRDPWSWKDNPVRIAEAGFAREAIYAACDDATDVEIVRRREDQQTMEEIGAALNKDKSTVCRRLAAIEQRYMQRNS